MINLNVKVRRAVAQDHYQIANLLFHESHTHRHLDWRSVLDWLGAQNFWVLDEHGFITAAFACPEDPQDIAWIRLFTYHPHLDLREAWSALWESSQAEIFQNNPNAKVSSIVIKPWFQDVLLQSGFEQKQSIALLRLRIEKFKPFAAPQNLHIRRMKESDISFVADVDYKAFGSFWHNSFDSIRFAYAQAISATVAENELNEIIGYQLSTGNRFGAHLARLAVSPQAQGRGVASALVSHLIQNLDANQNSNLSVNTQEDNMASLALYKKLGFSKTGEYFPVLIYNRGL
ncbi:MAG: GNAT family N-acetyltransferase [Anaerolineales bacterium]|nr:GNAT family N-acetyltransferase [Anaerolineales bacterium]